MLSDKFYGCAIKVLQTIAVLIAFFLFFYNVYNKAFLFILIPAAVIFFKQYQTELSGWLFLKKYKLKVKYRNREKLIKPIIYVTLIIAFVKLVDQSIVGYKSVQLTDRNEFSKWDVIDGDTVMTHKRVWSDYDHVGYETTFSISYKNKEYSKQNKRKVPVRKFEDFTNVYQSIAQFDRPFVKSLCDSLEKIIDQRGLNTKQFAEMAVSMVQDIPYILILEGSCDKDDYNHNFIEEFLNSCNACCKGNVYAGVQTPAQLMYDLKADCDSRTLLLYCIFDYFNYNVCILNSDLYSHSILGLAIPGTGLYKEFNGYKYYTWETTSPGFKLGQLDNNMQIMYYWKVALNNSNA